MALISQSLAQRYSALWNTGPEPPDVYAFLREHAAASPRERLDVLFIDQQQRWRCGRPSSVEDYCRHVTDIAADPTLKLKLVVEECAIRLELGEVVDEQQILSRFPDLDPQTLRTSLGQARSTKPPRCDSTVDVAAERVDTNDVGNVMRDGAAECRENPSEPQATTIEAPIPRTIGRYRIFGLLGQGAFGQVYRAHDDELQRDVAIKVPHRHRLQEACDLEAYRTEAQTVARLDHPNIVPVYDVGQMDDGRCFVVSKFVDGTDLRQAAASRVLSYEEVAIVIAAVANALHHAHNAGLVHRDIKPENILIDRTGKGFLTDFGIALREEEEGEGSGIAGTPSYMSPEQARGQADLVDGRSDIFGLGAVLYELLTGKKPFGGASAHDVMQRIATTDVRPPRQRSDKIPVEMERICLKAMSRDPPHRYPTALDMATDLRRFIQDESSDRSPRFHLRTTWGRVGCTVVAMALLLLAVVPAYYTRHSWRMASNIDSASRSKNNLEIASPGPPLPVAPDQPAPVPSIERFEIRVYGQGKPGLLIDDPASRPIVNGDQIRFSIQLSQPAHVYLAWIDTTGAPQELYPLDPERGMQPDVPIAELESPEEPDRGWPVIGSPGMENAVLLVSRAKLPDALQSFTSLLAIKPRKASDPREVVWYRFVEGSAAGSVERGLHRGLGSQAEAIDEPILQLMGRLRKQFDAVGIVGIAHATQK